jgi:hypothetical protein
VYNRYTVREFFSSTEMNGESEEIMAVALTRKKKKKITFCETETPRSSDTSRENKGSAYLELICRVVLRRSDRFSKQII